MAMRPSTYRFFNCFHRTLAWSALLMAILCANHRRVALSWLLSAVVNLAASALARSRLREVYGSAPAFHPEKETP